MLERKERNKVYKLAYNRYKESNFTAGMCYELNNAVLILYPGVTSWSYMGYETHEWPEFEENEPISFRGLGHWFPLEDCESRYRIFKNIIFESSEYTPDIITELKDNQIFVFGSNLSGWHAGGAAKAAMSMGAIWNHGVGIQGQTYAIPTKDYGISRTLTIAEIKPHVDEFIKFAQEHNELEFLVTEIGCGLAGLTYAEVAPLFTEALDIDNIILPKKFLEILYEINTDVSIDKI